MGSPGGEPRVLLNALKPMLGVVGDIKTSQEVLRVIGMMKDAEKLMSRCVYLNILKATCRQAKNNDEKKATMERFLTTGGWGILNKWLHEFTRSQNYPVLLELVDVLKIMPVTVELLKQGNTGKLMKQMTKLENVEVKKSAMQLIKQWKGMIRGGNTEIQETPSKRSREIDTKGNGDKPEKRAKLSGTDKGVSDSSGFMNALNASTPLPAKKKKRTNSKDTKTTLPLDEILNKASDEKKIRLESDGDRSTDNPGSPDADTENADSSLLSLSPAVEAANKAFQEDRENGIVVDEGSLARKKNKKKRNITWATDDKLVQVSYFELLPGERKAHHAENFSLARQHELMLEKQALKSRRGEDKMVELVQWSHLIPVDNAGVPNFVSGEKSREKYLQAEREKNVLAFIFLTRESLPNSPAEPEFDPDEHSAHTQPRMIPHDEDGTIFPSKATSNPVPNNLPEEEKLPSPVTTKPNVLKVETNKSNYKDDLSPAVQNIMATLLQKNKPNNQNGNNAQQKGNGNQLPANSTSTEGIPSILDSNIPNPRARNAHSGPRFPSGRGEGSGGPMRGRGGYNGQRPRWDGPPGMQNQNQPPIQDDWNNYEGNNYDYYNEGYDNYDNYRGGNNNRGGGHFRNDGYNTAGGGRGFHRGGGGNAGRGRGGGNWGKNPNGPPNRGNHNQRGGNGNGNRGKPICQHFGTSRGCRNGDRCNFLHVRR